MSTVPGAQSQHGSSGRGCSCSPAGAAASAPRLGSARAGGRGSGMGCGSLASKGQGKSSVWGCPAHQGGQCHISSACGGQEHWEGLVGPATPGSPGCSDVAVGEALGTVSSSHSFPDGHAGDVLAKRCNSLAGVSAGTSVSRATPAASAGPRGAESPSSSHSCPCQRGHTQPRLLSHRREVVLPLLAPSCQAARPLAPC